MSWKRWWKLISCVCTKNFGPKDWHQFWSEKSHEELIVRASFKPYILPELFCQLLWVLAGELNILHTSKSCNNVVHFNNSNFRYWHRSLNPKKLIEVQFSHLSRNMTMQRQIKLLKLNDTTKIEGLRPLTSQDVAGACKLLNEVRLLL